MAEICILLSKENLKLSQSEVKSVLKASESKIDKNLIFFELDTDFVQKQLKKIAYSKMAFEILLESKNPKILEKELSKTKLGLEKSETFGIRTINLMEKSANFDLSAIAKNIYFEGLGEVDLTCPKQEFFAIQAKKTYFCRLLWKNKEDFESRKASKRPSPHPTSMNPKIARCLINLANPCKNLIDPFCGSGGILLEGGVLGLKTVGIDLDPIMIKRAENNLKHYKIKDFELIAGDALNWNNPVECAVTDVPYGKSSKLREELQGLIKRFLTHYKPLTDKIVLVAPNTMNAEKIAQEIGWSIKEKFTVYVHNTLTREILVLEK